MASIFLSYERRDQGRAQRLAAVLDSAGHAVWWDRQIQSGSQYSKAIEQALAAAEAVIVLWSANSVDSPWVRDEAAVGRDSARLVPATLDGTEPPLGFRQFQTINLAGWRGRGSSPELKRLLADLDRLGAQPPITTPVTSVPRRLPSLSRFLIPSILLLLVGGSALWVWFGRSPKPTVVAIAPTSMDALTRDVTDGVRVQLGELHSSSVSDYRLLAASDTKGAQLRLAVGATQQPDGLRANVALISTGEETVLWSREFGPEPRDKAVLVKASAFAATRVLGCALEELSGKYRRLPDRLRNDYLAACASRAEHEADPDALIPPFRAVVTEAPSFAPAWAQLLRAEVDAANLLVTSGQSPKRLRADLRHDIEAGHKADPEMPELALAKIAADEGRPMIDVMAALDETAAEYPLSAVVLHARATAKASVGRTFDAIDDSQRAAELDPVSSTYRASYISALTYAGRLELAQKELGKAKALWPSSQAVSEAGDTIELRYGDLKNALRRLGHPSDAGILTYIAARRNPTKSNIDAFVALARTHELNSVQKRFLLEALPELNRVDDLYKLLASWPADESLRQSTNLLFHPWNDNFRRDARFIPLAKRFGLTDYWLSSGRWPDFCSAPDLPYNCKAAVKE